MVAEDEPSVRRLATALLEENGYTVIWGTESAHAERLCASHEGPVHLLLADVAMPGRSGPMLAERLRALFPDLKVLYMSGISEEQLVADKMLPTASSFLEKPFTGPELLRRVREVLDGA